MNTTDTTENTLTREDVEEALSEQLYHLHEDSCIDGVDGGIDLDDIGLAPAYSADLGWHVVDRDGDTFVPDEDDPFGTFDGFFTERVLHKVDVEDAVEHTAVIKSRSGVYARVTWKEETFRDYDGQQARTHFTDPDSPQVHWRGDEVVSDGEQAYVINDRPYAAGLWGPVDADDLGPGLFSVEYADETRDELVERVIDPAIDAVVEQVPEIESEGLDLYLDDEADTVHLVHRYGDEFGLNVDDKGEVEVSIVFDEDDFVWTIDCGVPDSDVLTEQLTDWVRDVLATTDAEEDE